MQSTPPAARFTATGAALYGLLREVERLAAQDPLRGRAALLQEIASGPPRTISDLARARSATRQSVRRVALDLVAEGLARLEPNPAHRRARCLVPTAAGLARARADAASQVRACNARARSLDMEDLRRAERLLRRLRGDGMSSPKPGPG